MAQHFPHPPDEPPAEEPDGPIGVGVLGDLEPDQQQPDQQPDTGGEG